jgi:3-phosphoshikimate 1-carboxyvinyltransferase
VAALERPVAGTEPNVATVRQASRLRAELTLPGDKSISHRALMLALLAEGTSRIDGCGDGADVRSTAGIAGALGATVERLSDDGRNVSYRIVSPGVDGLHQPAAALDCGNSGTSLRLFAGILAGLPLKAVLDGDASLRGRPVARIIEPLRSMGAELSARQDDSLPPVTVIGRTPLRPVEWTTAVPSAQVKSAVLLAGLRAEGTTRVHESVATRDHTERMLRARGIDVRTELRAGGGASISIEGGASVQAIDERVPGDLSSAAFWLVAGAIHPDADLTIRSVGVNPTRRAGLDLLRAMSGSVDEDVVRSDGEPTADLRVRSSALRGVDIGPADVAAAIDELPILCLAATRAHGRTTIRGAGELRHKETDRIAGIVNGLGAMGAEMVVDGDDLMIEGPTPLHGADVDSRGDHRLAMMFAIAGLIADGETRIHDAASAAVSYPGFFGDLERIRA